MAKRDPAPEASIDFEFIVAKVESMADGSPRVTIDLKESNLPEASMLWAAKLGKIVLHAHITQVKSLPNLDGKLNETEQESKSKTKRIGRQRL